jgi:sensor histidine kinase YesM
MVRTYLEVEKVRFDDRLNYTIDYDRELLAHYLIPRFLLQPLIENAIKHGISKIVDKGIIRLQITAEDQMMTIIIQDNGPDFPQHFTSSYGLQSTSDKLEMLCGKDARLEINHQPYKHIKITLKSMTEAGQIHAAPALLESQTRYP